MAVYFPRIIRWIYVVVVMHDNIHIPDCFENGMNKEDVIPLIHPRHPGTLV